MKNIIKAIFIIVLTIGIVNKSFAIEETSNINWKKDKISKMYNKNTEKLHFLFQFKANPEPIIDYEFSVKIITKERKRTCEGNFIYNGTNTIYSICSINIDNIETLNKEIKLLIEVENPESNETEFIYDKNFYNLKNELIKEKENFHPGVSIKDSENKSKEKEIIIETDNKYNLTEKDKLISLKITDEIINFIRKNKINKIEVINKIEKLTKNKKINIRSKYIIQDIIKNLNK